MDSSASSSGSRYHAARPGLLEALLLGSTIAAPIFAALVIVVMRAGGVSLGQSVELALIAVLAAGGVALGVVMLQNLRSKRVRPLRAIATGLERYAEGAERELLALSLSDSYGLVARSWNDLIRELAGLQEAVATASGASNVDATLATYEVHTLQHTLSAIPVGILRLDASGRVSYANEAACRLLAQPSSPVGGEIDQILAGLADDLVAAWHRKPNQRFVCEWERPSESHAIPTEGLRFELLSRDAEGPRDQLLLIHDVGFIREAQRSRDAFMYHVTHELRTPLTNIHAYAETLAQPEFDDPQTRRECYNVIISETTRLSELIEDMLSLSQLELGALRINWGEIDCGKLIRQVVEDHLGQADERQIELTLSVPPKPPRLCGDKHRVAVLLTNLVGNALKYTREGGKVAVRLEGSGAWVRISVSDTGCGIGEEEQERVFEKFYRSENRDLRGIKGTGLGLAIAREVARLHGGDVHLESKVNEGSTFTVELPNNLRKLREAGKGA